MDYCPSHVKQEVLGILTAATVRIIIFASHTAHIFQVLDLTLFGAFRTAHNINRRSRPIIGLQIS
jgi:hypothetical protein